MLKQFTLKVRRAETPGYRRLKRLVVGILTFQLPLPKPMKLIYSLLGAAADAIGSVLHRLWVFFYRSPVFRSRCAEVGRRLYLERVPYVTGNVKIRIGNGVKLSGQVGFLGGRVYDEPEIVLGDRVFLGHGVILRVAQQILIEEGAALAGGTTVSDNDGHSIGLMDRLSGGPPAKEEVKPVRIGRYAWVGVGCHVMKGVTIGEGALVGAGSVVVSDIPAFCIAMGHPARVVKKLEPPPGGLDAIQKPPR